MVEDYEEHGGAAEEDGEGVEGGVGDHGCGCFWLVDGLGLGWLLVDGLVDCGLRNRYRGNT